MLRKFFGTSHPWLMQAIGGGIAVIVMIPISVYVAYRVFVQSPTTAAAPRYQAPQQSQGAGNTSSPASAGSGSVVMMEPGDAPAGYVFSPSTLTVKAGTTVTWKDADSMAHNILGQGNAAGLINYGASAPGTGPYKVTFTKPGTYHYRCTLHPGMVGQIIVK